MKEEKTTCVPEICEGFDSPEREAEIRAISRELFPDYEPIDVDRALASASQQELEVMNLILKWVGIQVLPPLLHELDRELRQHYAKVFRDQTF